MENSSANTAQNRFEKTDGGATEKPDA